MNKVRIIKGFTDKETLSNYQDNDIIKNDFDDARYKELKEKGYIEDYIEPAKEEDNTELLSKIGELEKELENAKKVPNNAKDLKKNNEELSLRIAELEKENNELKGKIATLEENKVIEDDENIKENE